MKRVRTFIAVDLAPAIQLRAVEIAQEMAPLDPNVRWADPDQMHLTLKFLGDVDEVEISEVCAAAAKVADQFTPFSLVCAGVGAFPTVERVRTIWLGVVQGEAELVALNESLDETLAPLRFPRETRRFHPHVTLGRVKGQGRPSRAIREEILRRQDTPGEMMEVDGFSVYSSRLGRFGPSYELLTTLDFP